MTFNGNNIHTRLSVNQFKTFVNRLITVKTVWEIVRNVRTAVRVIFPAVGSLRKAFKIFFKPFKT